MSDQTLDNLQTFDPGISSSSSVLCPGMFLGEHQNFRLEKYLGSGGMGQAWLVTEIRGGLEIRQAVCKIVSRNIQNDQEALEKILRQFRLTRDLVHQNICPVYGLESDPTHGLFFVMAFAGGGTLWDWFFASPNSRRPRPLSEVVEVLAPIASALDYAHQMGVIHRDVKPQNIMFATLNGHRIPWLIDFSISARLHETMTATQGQYSASGTPFYMAPEQWEEEKQDERTDQYALAAIAYHFLAGRPPFEAKNQFALGHKVVSGSVPVIESLSPEKNAVLRRGLAKRKEDRFSTCMEFMEALKSETPTQAEPRVEIWTEPPAQSYSRTSSSSTFQSESQTQAQLDFFSASFSSANGGKSVSTHVTRKHEPPQPQKTKAWKDLDKKQKDQVKGYVMGCVGPLIIVFLICFLASPSPSPQRKKSSRPTTTKEYTEKAASQEIPSVSYPVQMVSDSELRFSSVLISLQQRNIDAAERELLKARGAAPGSEAEQIELAAKCFIDFYKSVEMDLKRLSPPHELCKGEYSLVENDPQKVVIHAEGQSLHFSMLQPQDGAQNLFEIFYRHRAMKAEGTGNMQPALGYAAYILFTEFADQAPARKLLDEVQAKGNENDRKTAQALKTVFKL